MGSADPPPEKWMKNYKAKTCKKDQFSMFIFWEQSGQAGVGLDNGATLTTYLFRYTSECTISWSNFQNILCLRRQGSIDPLTKILRTFLYERSFSSSSSTISKAWTADSHEPSTTQPLLSADARLKKWWAYHHEIWEVDRLDQRTGTLGLWLETKSYS